MVELAHGQAVEPQRASGQLMSWPYHSHEPDIYFDTQPNKKFMATPQSGIAIIKNFKL